MEQSGFFSNCVHVHVPCLCRWTDSGSRWISSAAAWPCQGLARMPVLKQLIHPSLQCNLLPSDIGIITISSIHQGTRMGFWSSLRKSALPLGKQKPLFFPPSARKEDSFTLTFTGSIPMRRSQRFLNIGNQKYRTSSFIRQIVLIFLKTKQKTKRKPKYTDTSYFPTETTMGLLKDQNMKTSF